MTSMYDLSQDLVGEILSRVPMTSLGAVRSTCKLWNTLSKDPSFKLCVKEVKDIMVITWHGFKPCLMSVNLHNHQSLIDLSIKKIGTLKQVEVKMLELFYCNGLLLCVAYDEHSNSWLVVWNPYTSQTRWIQPRKIYGTPKRNLYGMGYNSNNHHKILRIYYLCGLVGYEIYDFKTNSWRVLDVTIDWHVMDRRVSLKGNNYFITRDRSGVGEEAFKNCLLCFDFTRERFWSVPLPFSSSWEDDSVILSAVREEKLAVLARRRDSLEIEIWITNKIDEPNVESWSCFFKIDKKPIYVSQYLRGSFFVDEKEKVAVIFYVDLTRDYRKYKACMVGEGGHYREVDLKETSSIRPFFCSSYVPSSVKI